MQPASHARTDTRPPLGAAEAKRGGAGNPEGWASAVGARAWGSRGAGLASAFRGGPGGRHEKFFTAGRLFCRFPWGVGPFFCCIPQRVIRGCTPVGLAGLEAGTAIGARGRPGGKGGKPIPSLSTTN